MAEPAALQYVDLEFTGNSDGEAGDQLVTLLTDTHVQWVQVQAMFAWSGINSTRVNDIAVFRLTGTAAELTTVIGRYENLLA